MKFLYLDFDTLENAAIANGFKIQKIKQLEDSYLAKLTLKCRFILHSKSRKLMMLKFFSLVSSNKSCKKFQNDMEW